MVTRTAYDTYYMLYSKRISMKMKNQIREEFIPWMRARLESFGKVDPKTLDTIRDIARSELYDTPCPDDHERIAEWVNNL